MRRGILGVIRLVICLGFPSAALPAAADFIVGRFTGEISWLVEKVPSGLQVGDPGNGTFRISTHFPYELGDHGYTHAYYSFDASGIPLSEWPFQVSFQVLDQVFELAMPRGELQMFQIPNDQRIQVFFDRQDDDCCNASLILFSELGSTIFDTMAPSGLRPGPFRFARVSHYTTDQIVDLRVDTLAFEVIKVPEPAPMLLLLTACVAAGWHRHFSVFARALKLSPG